MMRRNTVGTWCLVLASMPILFSSAAFAAPHKSVPAEQFNGGTPIQQIIDLQAEQHARLTAEAPAGIENGAIRVDLTPQDRIDMAVPANVGGPTPLRIGVVKSVSAGGDIVRGQAFKRGVEQQLADGSFVWAVTVSSPGAQAIRVHFRNFSLPDGAELYVYNTRGQVDGPYTGSGRNGTGDFWSRSIDSDTGVIQLRYGQGDKNKISFVISDVGHINGRPPRKVEQSHDSWPCSDNASCVVDANCVNGTPAEPAKDAVAKMEWISGAFINTCTGGLLADTDAGSQIPLFLTANHCISKSVSSMEFFFNYTTASCNGSCPDGRVTGGTPPAANAVGFTVLNSGRKGDYTLGQLNQSPPAGAVFLGWTNAPIAFTEGAGLYRISNPNFGPQAYSQHDVDTNAGTCRSWPRGERIYSNDVSGATMGGSSGSPVVNSSSQVVGQLSGCCGFNCGDVCDPGSNSTVDGALAFYFANVEPFLDPQGGGGCSGDPECDDGDACNGAETCVSGSCQNGTPPACQNGDGCCPSGCTSANDDDCVACTGGQAGDSCTLDADCCSNKCKGRAGAKTCK